MTTSVPPTDGAYYVFESFVTIQNTNLLLIKLKSVDMSSKVLIPNGTFTWEISKPGYSDKNYYRD